MSPPGQRSDRQQARSRLPDRLWLPAVAAGLLAMAFVAVLLVRAGGDPSLLVHAGAPCTTARAAPALPSCDAAVRPGSSVQPGAPGSLTVQPADEAFDGQFFYRIGVAPWSSADRVAGVQFDLPALRNARWGYGALAYVASGGDPDLVPWALIVLNLAAAVAVGAVGGGLARSSGRHAGWGLLLALWPGFAYSLSLDTSELVASAFLLGGLLALRRRRWVVAALTLIAAVLTRDTTAVVPVGVAAAGLWTWWATRGDSHTEPVRDVDAQQPKRGQEPIAASAEPNLSGMWSSSSHIADKNEYPNLGASLHGAATVAATETAGPQRPAGDAAAAAGIAALVAFVAWQLTQWARFASLPITSSGDNNLTAPLSGLVTELGHDLPPGSSEEAFRLLCITGLVALVATGAWCWRRSAAPLAERLAWLPALAVAAVLNAYLWSGATAFARASTEIGLLSVLIILGSSMGESAERPVRTSRRSILLPLVGVGLAAFWLLTAAVQVTKLG